jgi:hypothetical protein
MQTECLQQQCLMPIATQSLPNISVEYSSSTCSTALLFRLHQTRLLQQLLHLLQALLLLLLQHQSFQV